MANRIRYYWDTCMWAAWNKDEDGFRELGTRMLRAVDEGRLEIATSSFTLAEFTPATEEQDTLLEDYLERDGFVPVGVNIQVAREARRLTRLVPYLSGADALHVASACLSHCNELHTTDGKHMLDHADEIRELTGLIVCRPHWDTQMTVVEASE